MIILNSNKILEQLSEIENVIKKFEAYLDEYGAEVDREKILLKILRTQEVKITARAMKKEI